MAAQSPRFILSQSLSPEKQENNYESYFPERIKITEKNQFYDW